MSGAPVTTTPTPVVDAIHRRAYAYTQITTSMGTMWVLEYMGIASPNTKKSDATGWAITKFIYSTVHGQVTDQLWADGTETFDKSWDSYLTYTYSNT